MIELSNPPPHRYGCAGFDRAAHRRNQADWLRDRRRDPATRVLMMAGLEVLSTTADDPRLLITTLGEIDRTLSEEAIFLGEDPEGRALFAADLGRGAAPGGRFVELRTIGAWLPALEAGCAASARGLAFWHGRHRFCGACGGPTVSEQGGYVRRCQICDAQHFPRSDPAVIVLVVHHDPEHGERCLLGRSTRFPAGLYSTLAGFVEPGESLEDTVTREVFEESGVRVRDIVYRSSQPWPFPASLMLGFRAVAESDALTIDPDELVDARWCSRYELEDPDKRPVGLPNRDSIARHLIEDWLSEGEP